LSRTSVFIGKVVGGSTDTIIQTILLLIIGYAFVSAGIMTGINFNLMSVLITLAFLLVTTAGLVSVGLIIGSLMESPEGFQLIGSFVLFPMFFLSGSLFPIDNLPSWLSPIVLANPITYAIDGIRGVLLKGAVEAGLVKFSTILDFAVITSFSIAMILIGSYAFKRMKF